MAWSALAAAAIAAGASTYASSQASAAQRRQGLLQQRANQQAYDLNRSQLQSQDEAARISRADQWAQYTAQANDAALERQIALQQMGADRLDAVQQRGLLQRLAAADRRRAMEGSRDARGNAVEYVEGIGFVERPSADTQRLIRASDTEELQRNTVDANRARLERGRDYNRRIGEGALANAIMARLLNSRDDSAGVEARNTAAGVTAANLDAATTRGPVNAALARSGAGGVVPRAADSSIPRTLAAIAASRASSPAQAASERSSRDNQTANLYNMMASRASGGGDSPAASTGVDETLAQASRARQGVMPQAMGAASAGAAAGAGLMRGLTNASSLATSRSPVMGNNPQAYARQTLNAPNLMLPTDQTATVIGGAGSQFMNVLQNKAVQQMMQRWFGGGDGVTRWDGIRDTSGVPMEADYYVPPTSRTYADLDPSIYAVPASYDTRRGGW